MAPRSSARRDSGCRVMPLSSHLHPQPSPISLLRCVSRCLASLALHFPRPCVLREGSSFQVPYEQHAPRPCPELSRSAPPVAFTR